MSRGLGDVYKRQLQLYPPCFTVSMGIEDVCLSTLTLVGPNGIQGKVQMRMNKEEVALLKKSADALKEVIAQIEL